MSAPTILVTSWGETSEVTAQLGHYGNHRLAVSFTNEIGDPHSTLTVNLPDQHLNDGEVFVKDWGGNEPLVAALTEAGWLIPTGREVQSGYVFPKVMRPSGPLAEHINRQEQG